MTELRLARREDLARVFGIVRAAFGPFCIAKLLEDRFGVVDERPWYEHKAGEVVRWCENNLANVIVAEVDGRVAGFATFMCSGQTGRVGNNAVDPAFQGRGLGSRLVWRVLETMQALGMNRYEVSTLEHDAPARRVYEKHGYRLRAAARRYARRTDSGVELKDAPDVDAWARREAEGFKLMCTTVNYEMTASELEQALDALDRVHTAGG